MGMKSDRVVDWEMCPPRPACSQGRHPSTQPHGGSREAWGKPNQSRVTSVLFRFICRDELLSQGTEWKSGARVSPCPRRMGPPVLSESCAASPSWIAEGWRGLPADRRARCSQDCQAELCRERVCRGGGQVAAWTACFSRLGAETSAGPPCPAQAFPTGTCFQGRHM